MYVLVRHGHALEKKGWRGVATDRPLSERGVQQAEGLAENLHALLGPRLLASPYLRCRQTLAPLAAKLGADVSTCDLLAPDVSVSRLDLLLAGPDIEGAVLCTHGETLTALFALWLRQGTLDLADGGDSVPHTEKGGAWVVVIDDGERHSVHYQRPLHVGPLLDDTAG